MSNVSFTTKRAVTEVVTTKRTITKPTAVSVTLAKNSHGSPVVVINGQKALVISASGYLRRLPGLTASTGVNRLEDGRIAMKKSA